MAIDKGTLTNLLQQAFDKTSDVVVDPAEARKQLAVDIANAVEAYVIGRETMVTGTSVSGGAVTGKGVIQ